MKLDKDPLTELDVTHRPPQPPTVYEIVKRYLQERGHEGLCNPSLECGCGLADLMCCEMSPFGCQPSKEGINEDGEQILVLDDRPTGPIGPICDGMKKLLELEAKHGYFQMVNWTCPVCGETTQGNNLGGPLYYHDCKGGATVECACCHQVVGISHAVYQNGQELCPKCAE